MARAKKKSTTKKNKDFRSDLFTSTLDVSDHELYERRREALELAVKMIGLTESQVLSAADTFFKFLNRK